MTHPDQDIIDFLTKNLDLRAAPDWMIERARAFRDGGWLPIETAPRDGEFILVFQKEKTPVVAYMSQSVGLYSNLGWQSVPGDKRYKPTHWRPLPNPPKDTEQ